jgi:hypothetical protein
MAPLLICQPLPLAQVALLSEASQWVILVATQSMADNSMALVLPCLPNTTYDLPALILPLGSAR